MAIGAHNQMRDADGDLVGMSLALGTANTVEAGVFDSIVSGANNHVGVWTSGPGEVSVSSSATFGNWLENRWSNATIIGQYNATTPPATLLFAIGNGNDANNRSNAVEVYKDGKVIIRQAQGDILMGEFGN